MMGGHISVESRPDAGSTFRFDVRLRTAPEQGAAPAPNDGQAIESRPEAVDTPVALRVLLAEDNATNLFVATRMLERLGHRVVSVTDGHAAVQAVREGGHDIVLMDMMMPEMDGITATRLIRALPPDQGNVPIVGLTANAMPADEEACRAAGMDGFVTKPVKAARLEAVMREAMARRPVTPRPRRPTGPAR
jgi:CheY-like chemotaxis protein